MSPIDRVQRRSEMFSVLGVSRFSSKKDIRQAYRKLAFEKHPDRNPEAAPEFMAINEAYRYICDNAEELGIDDGSGPVRPRSARRPQTKPTETNFDDATIAECEALLTSENPDAVHHVATSVYRLGRSLTYFVKTKLAPGLNAVVVPTGMLHDNRHVLPTILVFDKKETSIGLFEMTEEMCAQYFPGARSVQIRFGRV